MSWMSREFRSPHRIPRGSSQQDLQLGLVGDVTVNLCMISCEWKMRFLKMLDRWTAFMMGSMPSTSGHARWPLRASWWSGMRVPCEKRFRRALRGGSWISTSEADDNGDAGHGPTDSGSSHPAGGVRSSRGSGAWRVEREKELPEARDVRKKAKLSSQCFLNSSRITRL